jgi:hypothetical protein
VSVTPAVVGRQQIAQHGEQVVVAPRTGLDDGDPRGRVRHEDMKQAISLASDKLGAVRRQVDDRL